MNELMRELLEGADGVTYLSVEYIKDGCHVKIQVEQDPPHPLPEFDETSDA